MSLRPGQKFDREELYRLVMEEKKTDGELAKMFKVTPQAIGAERRKLRLSIVKETSLVTAHRMVEKQLDVVDQLSRINKKTNEILVDLFKKINKQDSKTIEVEGQKDVRTLALDAIKETRQQLTLQMDIFKTLADYKVMQAFQQEVLDTIGNSNKCPVCGELISCPKCQKKIDLRAVIIQRLKETKALRTTVELVK